MGGKAPTYHFHRAIITSDTTQERRFWALFPVKVHPARLRLSPLLPTTIDSILATLIGFWLERPASIQRWITRLRGVGSICSGRRPRLRNRPAQSLTDGIRVMFPMAAPYLFSRQDLPPPQVLGKRRLNCSTRTMLPMDPRVLLNPSLQRMRPVA
jgi:hypothetical protein